MDNKNPDENNSPYSKRIEKAVWREQTYAQIVDELTNNPEVQQLKEKYRPSSVDTFIKDYATVKLNILEWGPSKEEWNESHETQWADNAFEGLNQIQQKKLFDLQCLWRAGKIDLDEVLISEDFTTWEQDVMNCPFIPPITEQEIDLYILYLQSNNYEEDSGMSLERWQDYEEIKEAYNSDDANRNFPEWYDFYNSRMGTGVYMLFPDVRGRLETFYRQLSHEFDSVVQLAEKEKTSKPAPAVQSLPLLFSSDKENLRWFVYTFEDKETQEFAELYQAFRNTDDFDFDWTFDKDLLQSVIEPIPVLPWYNWREALHRSAEMYRRTKTIQAMPLVYESYCIRRNAGIPFEKPNHNKDYDDLKIKLRQKIIENIIQGRVLNGEPPDLNF